MESAPLSSTTTAPPSSPMVDSSSSPMLSVSLPSTSLYFVPPTLSSRAPLSLLLPSLTANSSLLIFNSTLPMVIPTASVPPPRYSSHPALSLSNIRSHITEVLDYNNFLLWKELFLPIFRGYQVMDHIDGTPPPPLLVCLIMRCGIRLML